MTLESLLLTALFALTAVAFIGALNARGVWRAVTAALLVLFCLGAALWQLTAYRAARLAGLPPASGSSLRPGAVDAGTDEARRGDAAQGNGDAPDGTDPADLGALIAAARDLRDGMAAEDPSRARALNDSEYQAFERRAGGHLSRARMLRERAARLAAAPPSSGWEEAAELLNLSLHSLNTAARDLQAFFRATGREEEQRLTAAFRRGVEAADAPLRRAESRAGALSGPSSGSLLDGADDFEAREP